MKKRVNLKNEAMLKREVLLEQERLNYHTPDYYKKEILTEGKWSWLDKLWKSSPTIKALGKKTRTLFETAMLSKNADDWKVAFKQINTSSEEIFKIADDYLIKNPKLKQQYNIPAKDIQTFYKKWLGTIFTALQTDMPWDEFLKAKNINPDAYAEGRLLSFIDSFLDGSPSVKKVLHLSKGKVLKPKLSEELLEIIKNGVGRDIREVAEKATDGFMGESGKADMKGGVVLPHDGGKLGKSEVTDSLSDILGVSKGTVKAVIKTTAGIFRVIRIKRYILGALGFVIGSSVINSLLMLGDEEEDWRMDGVFPGKLLGGTVEWLSDTYVGDKVGEFFKGLGGFFSKIGENEIKELAEKYIEPIFEGMTVEEMQAYDCENFKDIFGSSQSYGNVSWKVKAATWFPGFSEEDVNGLIMGTDWNPLCNEIKKGLIMKKLNELDQGEKPTNDSIISSIKQELEIIEQTNNFNIPENLCSMFGTWYTDPNDGHAWSIDNEEEVNGAKVSFCDYKEDKEACYTAFMNKINSCKTNE